MSVQKKKLEGATEAVLKIWDKKKSELSHTAYSCTNSMQKKKPNVYGCISTELVRSVNGHVSRSSSSTAVETVNTNVGMMAMRA